MSCHFSKWHFSSFHCSSGHFGHFGHFSGWIESLNKNYPSLPRYLLVRSETCCDSGPTPSSAWSDPRRTDCRAACRIRSRSSSARSPTTSGGAAIGSAWTSSSIGSPPSCLFLQTNCARIILRFLKFQIKWKYTFNLRLQYLENFYLKFAISIFCSTQWS